MKRLFSALTVLGMLAGCGAGSVSALGTVLPTLSPSGSSIALSGGASGTLTFSTNDAPAQTAVEIAPIPAATPKWPLPEQIAGYTVTLSKTVTFSAFPPVMCISGAFSPSRTYELKVGDSSGNVLAQLPASVTASGVCTATVTIAGQMDANAPYTFIMMMSSQ